MDGHCGVLFADREWFVVSRQRCQRMSDAERQEMQQETLGLIERLKALRVGSIPRFGFQSRAASGTLTEGGDVEQASGDIVGRRLKAGTPNDYRRTTRTGQCGMTRVCPECGGSGMRWGCDREIECFDCGGEGSWEEDAVCLCCEGPLTDGECVACTVQLTEIEHLGPGRIAA